MNPNQYPWNGSLRYACTSHSVTRQWRSLVQAYVVYNGAWYAGEAWGGPNPSSCG
jgi:hypothetical protein